MLSEPQVNILLVDDRLENLLALEAVSGPLGHTLIKATSGREALKQLLSHDFAVILLDVQMPDIDGFETAELIRGRKRSQDMPIIFLTAVNTSERHVFRGYEVGAVDYLLKPIVPEVLLSKVAVFVELYKKNWQMQQQAQQLAEMVQALEREVAERRRTEEALRDARDELEERVRERTANLAATNEALRVEVSERERAEREVAQLLEREQQARTQAEGAVKLRDQFLSIASHELKTPLTSLYGNMQLLQRRVVRGDLLEDRNQRLLNVVVEQATRLNKLIESMLDISRIQTGQLTITRQPLDLDALAQRVVRDMQPLLEQHRLEFQAADAPLWLDGDELRLDQVLHNLVQNAVKYSPSGGTISVRAVRSEGWLCLSVSDEGIGIPAEALPHVFKRFYRADNADEQRIAGMGVGLFVVKEIVSLHGGEIEVQSTEGQGSVFTLRLPERSAAPVEA